MTKILEETFFLTAEWRHLIMLNFAVDPACLDPLVPAGTALDTYRGKPYVSLVGFLFLKTKVMGIPMLFHQEFEEVNLRFYVRRFDGGTWRRGVVFIKEIVPAFIISTSARFFYNENYVSCPMTHRVELDAGKTSIEYTWQMNGRSNRIAASTRSKPEPIAPGSLEEFITDHEWGYTRQRDGSSLEYRVAHPCWEVAPASESVVDCDGAEIYGPEFGPLLSKAPDSAFVIAGSAVIVFKGKGLDLA